MSGVRMSRIRVAALCLVLAIGIIAVLAGPTSYAAPLPGCQATSTLAAGYCQFKSRTGVVEIVGGGQAWGVWESSPYYYECTFDFIGAESTLCFVGTGSTVNAAAYIGFVVVRDVTLPI
jgi:hypothetical protein